MPRNENTPTTGTPQNISCLSENTVPYPDPINGMELVTEIKKILNTYLFMPTGADDAIAIWILHTYIPDAFDYTPRLSIISPEPRCGKTSLLDFLTQLSYRPLSVSGISASAMFRVIELEHPTLIIDEADTFINTNEELRGIINTGYKKDGKVIRSEINNKNFRPQVFICFAPCAIACIGKTPQTIADRSIIICMERKTKNEKRERIISRKIRPITGLLKSKCLRYMQDNREQISAIYPELPEWLDSRAQDITEPLFAIASNISPEYLTQFTSSIKTLMKNRSNIDELSLKTMLLSDIRSIFAAKDCEYIDSTVLVEELKNLEESPWYEYNYGRGLNVHSLAKLLKVFDIKPAQHRIGYNRVRQYALVDFVPKFERYLPPTSPTPQQKTEESCHNVTINTPSRIINEEESENLSDIPF